jgi:hypothetical protein
MFRLGVPAAPALTYGKPQPGEHAAAASYSARQAW